MYFRAHEITMRQSISSSHFKVSTGWMYCFMKRKSLSGRRKISPSEYTKIYFHVKIIAFHRFVIRLRKNQIYMLSKMGNISNCFELRCDNWMKKPAMHCNAKDMVYCFGNHLCFRAIVLLIFRRHEDDPYNPYK